MFPLSFESTLAIEVIRQILLGIAMGTQMIGSFVAGMTEVRASGFPESLSSASSFSTLFTSAFMLGLTVGPITGGFLVDKIDYDRTSTVLFTLQMVMVSYLADEFDD